MAGLRHLSRPLLPSLRKSLQSGEATAMYPCRFQCSLQASTRVGISIAPLHAKFGAAIEGVDVATVDQARFEQVIIPALLRYGVLVFRNQHHLRPEEQLRFTSMVPDADRSPVNPFSQNDPSCIPDLPQVRVLGNSTDEGLKRGTKPEVNPIGREWHTDGCGVSTLFAAEAPSTRPRTTLWACAYQAWDLLSPDLQHRASRLNGCYGAGCLLEASIAEQYRRGARMSENGLRLACSVPDARLSEDERRVRKEKSNWLRFEHLQGAPVRRHPETGRHVIFTTPLLLEGFDGFTEETSRDLLEQILLPGTSEDAIYEHSWCTGDVVLWDNRSTLHSTTPFMPDPHLMFQVFVRTKTSMLPPALL